MGRRSRGGSEGADGLRRADQIRSDPGVFEGEGVDEDAGDEVVIEDVVESEGAQHRRFRLQRHIKRRLDHYLRARLPGLSRSRLQKLINEGAVTVNEGEPKASTIVKLGDVIDVVVPPPTFKRVPAERIPLSVLYEDEHLIVLNKQPGLVVHPARSNMNGTMVNALAWHFRGVSENGLEALSRVGVEEFRPGIVHRLDKDTSGAIIVAKTDEAHWRMNKQFEKRTVQKYYLAIVHGEMEEAGGVIDQPIGKHPTVNEAYAVRNDDSGRQSVTLYRVREIYRGYSLVELELKSGRTHQIRVHLNWMGHPIVSDIVYGGEAIGEREVVEGVKPAGAQPFLTYAREKSEGVKMWDRIGERDDLLVCRPALHAAVLGFEHPITGAGVRVTAPMYSDMTGLIGRLRGLRGDGYAVKAEGVGVDLDVAMSDPVAMPQTERFGFDEGEFSEDEV